MADIVLSAGTDWEKIELSGMIEIIDMRAILYIKIRFT